MRCLETPSLISTSSVPPSPTTVITSAIDGNNNPVQNGASTRSNQITFQFTNSGGTPPIISQCSLDNSAFSSCSSPITYTNLAVGQHAALFRAIDNLALQGPSVAFTWQVLANTPPPDSACVGRGGGSRVITGTNGDDTLIGRSGSDDINGLGGNDGINGCGGSDDISGGNGDDRIAGSAGSDDLNGNAGNDIIQGDAGSDSISGGDGNDVLSGGQGQDILFGGNGNDVLTGGPGIDEFHCGPGTDRITDFQPRIDIKTADCEIF